MNIRKDPVFDFKGGAADMSSYYLPGVTASQMGEIRKQAAANPLKVNPQEDQDSSIMGRLSSGFTRAGNYIKDKILPGEVDKGKEVFGKINEFTNPAVLNEVQDPQSPFEFKGLESNDRGAFNGYFKTGELDRLKQYSNIGATDWKDDGSSGWDSSSMAEKGVDWRTSDQIKEAEDKLKFIPSTYEEAKEAGMGEDGFDYEGLMTALGSIKIPESDIPRSSGRVGGGFRFNENQYKNRLLERELEQLYMAPLYNRLY